MEITTTAGGSLSSLPFCNNPGPSSCPLRHKFVNRIRHLEDSADPWLMRRLKAAD
jgi:hypothetical protein